MLLLNRLERNEQRYEIEYHKYQEKLLPIVDGLAGEESKMVEPIKGQKEEIPKCPDGYIY
jgi:hypothetical protein